MRSVPSEPDSAQIINSAATSSKPGKRRVA